MENGFIISRLRYEHNLTQAELASKLGVSKGAIGMWETNKRDPQIDNIKKMAEIFGVSTDFLLGKSETDISHTPVIINPALGKENQYITPAAKKMLTTFAQLSEDNQDILIGKAKEMLKEQQAEEKRKASQLSAKAT